MLNNKHGWGLREMLVLSGVIIFFFLIAIYYINSLYREIGESATVTDYEKMEKNLADNALIYINDYYEGNLNSTGIKITRSTLREYNLDVSLVDNKYHSCSGYVYANKTHGITSTKGYIKCNGYTTAGYEE